MRLVWSTLPYRSTFYCELFNVHLRKLIGYSQCDHNGLRYSLNWSWRLWRLLEKNENHSCFFQLLVFSFSTTIVWCHIFSSSLVKTVNIHNPEYRYSHSRKTLEMCFFSLCNLSISWKFFLFLVRSIEKKKKKRGEEENKTFASVNLLLAAFVTRTWKIIFRAASKQLTSEWPRFWSRFSIAKVNHIWFRTEEFFYRFSQKQLQSFDNECLDDKFLPNRFLVTYLSSWSSGFLQGQ